MNKIHYSYYFIVEEVQTLPHSPLQLQDAPVPWKISHFSFSVSYHRIWSLTQAVEAERPVVKEVTDVTGLRGHGAEGMRAAGGEGVNTDEQHVHQQGPGVAVGQEIHIGAEHGEMPQEIPETNKQSGLIPQ